MRHLVIIMYDAPSDAEFDAWMHGPHYDEVRNTPGVASVRRYEIVDGAAGHKQYLAVLETTDPEATLAWRDGPEGRRSQREADERGVKSRQGLVCRLIYSSVVGEMDEAGDQAVTPPPRR